MLIWNGARLLNILRSTAHPVIFDIDVFYDVYTVIWDCVLSLEPADVFLISYTKAAQKSLCV